MKTYFIIFVLILIAIPCHAFPNIKILAFNEDGTEQWKETKILTMGNYGAVDTRSRSHANYLYGMINGGYIIEIEWANITEKYEFRSLANAHMFLLLFQGMSWYGTNFSGGIR